MIISPFLINMAAGGPVGAGRSPQEKLLVLYQMKTQETSRKFSIWVNGRKTIVFSLFQT